MKYAPCCDVPVKLTKQSRQERNGLNQWQPYFLLMVVLGVETEKNFLQVRFLEVNLLGWPAPFC